jgi:hypothetical protein
MNSAMSRRGNSPSRSAGGVADKPVEIDYLNNPEAYFKKLDQLQLNADAIRKDDSEQEKKLMEYLPVNEKFNLNKEGKVIARWQERQRDWERIQEQIKRRLTSKVQRPLMMTTTDEFRARSEEYDLLQAAVPLKDRFSDSSWQVMLRGGGPIRVPVGHIFSGLECEVDLNIPRPKMVRKPKSMDGVGKNDTFVDQTSTYLAIKKKYDASIREIRPHNLTFAEAGHLVVRSVKLFQWAKDSSAKYFAEKNEQEQYEQQNSVVEGSAGEGSEVLGGGATASFLGDSVGSRIELISSKEVVFDTLAGKNASQPVSFKNTGQVAVQYAWRQVGPVSSLKKFMEHSTLNGVLNSKGTDNGALRSRTLRQNRNSFFCLRNSGEILPGETCTTMFMFNGCAGGGSFSSEWVLSLLPEESPIYAAVPAGGGNNGGVANRQQQQGAAAVAPPLGVGSVCLRLKGLSVTEDESASRRAFLASHLDDGAVRNMALDIVHSCLRRVRNPVRLVDLQERQIALFRRVNAAQLASLSVRFGDIVPLFITPGRLSMFVEIYHSASAALVTVRKVLADRRSEYATWLADSAVLPAPSAAAQRAATAAGRDVYPELDLGDVDQCNPFVVTEDAILAMRTELFPEEIIVSLSFIINKFFFAFFIYLLLRRKFLMRLMRISCVLCGLMI